MNIKLILTVLIAAALISCSIFKHKKPSLSDNSQIAAPISNNSVNKNSHQLVQSERQLKDFLLFKKTWNTKLLKTFQEQQLDNVTNKAEEVYRFFWIPSFDNAIAIRVWQVGEKHFLVVKKVDGEGFHMEKLLYERKRKLTEEQWVKLIELTNQIAFWDMSTQDPDNDPNIDGALYVIESIKDKRFHEVYRGTGNSGVAEIQRVGAYLLSLSEIKTKYSAY